MEIMCIEKLFSKVTEIIDNNKNRIRDSGENFNIFKIMQMESNERYTHSSFIAELLNPNGSHGQGDVFLNSFIDIVYENKNIECLNKFDISSQIFPSLNHSEHYIGPIDPLYTVGGKIDILIMDNKQTLIIENKIHAPDQKNQLLRYYNYAFRKKNLSHYFT